ncbi:MAG: methionyl-tRNA formyltransferase [Pyrinomonadaceae bacterium]
MKIIFMGTPESAVPTLRRCVVEGHEVVGVWTQPDKPAGRGNKLKASPVKKYALSVGLEVHQPSKIRTEESLALFTAREFDAAVVVAYGRILPPSFLRAPRLGCVNVHFSLLPKYRGAAPVNWAIVRGEYRTGVTTMLMDEGLDTGPVLLQRETVIGERETAPELLERLSTEGAELLAETLARFDEIEPRSQDNEDATLAPILRREDGLIDWTMESVQIARRVRGLQPWPNAFTQFRGQKLVVWKASGPGGNPGECRPGEVIHARGDSLYVACGGGIVELLEVQLEGRNRVGARDFINGMRVQVGERFG